MSVNEPETLDSSNFDPTATDETDMPAQDLPTPTAAASNGIAMEEQAPEPETARFIPVVTAPEPTPAPAAVTDTTAPAPVPAVAEPAAGDLIRDGLTMARRGVTLGLKSLPAQAAAHRDTALAKARAHAAARTTQVARPATSRGAGTRRPARQATAAAPATPRSATVTLTPLKTRLERTAIGVAVIAALSLTVLRGPLATLEHTIHDATTPKVTVVYPNLTKQVATTRQAAKPAAKKHHHKVTTHTSKTR